MPKKTRKQKALADVRRQTTPTSTTTAKTEAKPHVREITVQETKPTAPEVRRTAPQTIVTTDYRYLAADLRKTLLLTTFIIVVELAIKFGTNL